MLKLHVLASGSAGNAAVVENAATGRGVLIDCGICKRDFLARCAEAGFDPSGIEAVAVTHEHGDHVKGLGVVLRGIAKLGTHPAVYANPASVAASSALADIAKAFDVRPMAAFTAAGMTVAPFPTSHDAAASCGFRIEDASDGDALGYMTDTGVVTPQAHAALSGVRLLAIEANHDPHMLETGPYPYPIKQRIASDDGHLSNDQAAAEVRALAHGGLACVVAMHVSQNNNEYGLARAALEVAVREAGANARVLCGYQARLTSVDIDA